ncbi:MAG TPA: efflux RND transporter periplasmic adaptor subunit [Acidimicrobiales bacterium]|nr:efflux RND transporter periplasmic adaptor subunit [Acidimicrobiales bacterium]
MPAVLVAAVEQRTVPIYAEFVARTDASDSVDLVARVEGVLEARSFMEGKRVEKDQLLYRIDPREYEANLKSAKAHLGQAQAQLNKSKQDVARYEPLALARAIPQQQLDAALADELVAEANVSAAEAAVTLAELDLSHCTIRAPFDGLIGKSLYSVGSLVGRGSPTVLNTISAIDPIRVSFGIPEAGYLSLMKRRGKGASPEIELYLADNSLYPWKGQVKFADRAVDLKTGTLELQGEFPNPDGLIRPNQFGRVRVVVDTVEGALLLPQKAVMEQQSAKYVLVVEADDKVVERSVALGPASGNAFVVKDGLKAGDRVIVEGQQKARPGSQVKPTEEPASAESASR